MRTIWRSVSIFLLIIFFSVIEHGSAFAQCAMCRATLENNVSNGDIGIAAGINGGILYLFAMPYILVAFIAFMWYRKSKENEQVRGYSPR